MQQIIQSYKTGEIEVVEVPVPNCGDNGILVKTTASLISAGTEKMLVDIAKKSLIGKARARPDLAKQVINKVKKEGLQSTFSKVLTKLEMPIPLGYSTSGEVIFVGNDVTTIHVGERVACAGAGFANHAEVNYIPKNLFAKVPDNVSDEEAAYTTVGAIALQGVRRLNPQIGEKIAVIGSGLIGLMTIQLLKANGCEVLAVDIDPGKLKLAEKAGADISCLNESLLSSAEFFTQGYGVDGVIIAASSKSKEILTEAGEISRMKGRVIMVGLTPIDVPRDIYYRKELDFRLSMSCGPGRYDPLYEIEGIDYPYHYVRWTERRNMVAFLSLIAQGKLNLKMLTTHRYKFTEALEAYKLISGKIKEKYLGIVLQYSEHVEQDTLVRLSPGKQKVDVDIKIGLIGAGNFANSVILPRLKKLDCRLVTLVNPSSVKSVTSGRKFGFQNISSQSQDIFDNPDINTVFITTPHNSHAKLVISALSYQKHVFVEKPLAISEEELQRIREASKKTAVHLMVGFNRRFSSHARMIRESLQSSNTPLVMNYLVNAGKIDPNHWIHDPAVGGGRVIGEVCHFVDFLQFICNSLPEEVFAAAVKTDNRQYANNDSLHILLRFENGSIGNITYHAVGDTTLPKEYFEVSGGGTTIKMYDFWGTEITRGGKSKKIKSGFQDKGFGQELKTFLDAIRKQHPSPIPFESLYITTLCTIRVIESLQTGLKLDVLTTK